MRLVVIGWFGLGKTDKSDDDASQTHEYLSIVTERTDFFSNVTEHLLTNRNTLEIGRHESPCGNIFVLKST